MQNSRPSAETASSLTSRPPLQRSYSSRPRRRRSRSRSSSNSSDSTGLALEIAGAIADAAPAGAAAAAPRGGGNTGGVAVERTITHRIGYAVVTSESDTRAGAPPMSPVSGTWTSHGGRASAAPPSAGDLIVVHDDDDDGVEQVDYEIDSDDDGDDHNMGFAGATPVRRDFHQSYRESDSDGDDDPRWAAAAAAAADDDPMHHDAGTDEQVLPGDLPSSPWSPSEEDDDDVESDYYGDAGGDDFISLAPPAVTAVVLAPQPPSQDKPPAEIVVYERPAAGSAAWRKRQAEDEPGNRGGPSQRARTAAAPAATAATEHAKRTRRRRGSEASSNAQSAAAAIGPPATVRVRPAAAPTTTTPTAAATTAQQPSAGSVNAHLLFIQRLALPPAPVAVHPPKHRYAQLQAAATARWTSDAAWPGCLLSVAPYLSRRPVSAAEGDPQHREVGGPAAAVAAEIGGGLASVAAAFRCVFELFTVVTGGYMPLDVVAAREARDVPKELRRAAVWYPEVGPWTTTAYRPSARGDAAEVGGYDEDEDEDEGIGSGLRVRRRILTLQHWKRAMRRYGRMLDAIFDDGTAARKPLRTGEMGRYVRFVEGCARGGDRRPAGLSHEAWFARVYDADMEFRFRAAGNINVRLDSPGDLRSRVFAGVAPIAAAVAPAPAPPPGAAPAHPQAAPLGQLVVVESEDELSDAEPPQQAPQLPPTVRQRRSRGSGGRTRNHHNQQQQQQQQQPAAAPSMQSGVPIAVPTASEPRVPLSSRIAFRPSASTSSTATSSTAAAPAVPAGPSAAVPGPAAATASWTDAGSAPQHHRPQLKINLGRLKLTAADRGLVCIGYNNGYCRHGARCRWKHVCAVCWKVGGGAEENHQATMVADEKHRRFCMLVTEM
ncbi:hypothetical protein DFJ73DRAFT_784928 [Zopfochytrium polystomum]|nr:hypothetical protein DFJ73DRAFT_784928 [Zopfochytrium polystomum]